MGDASLLTVFTSVNKTTYAQPDSNKGATLTQIAASDRAQMNAILEAVGVDWAEGLDKRGRPGSTVRREFLDALKDKN